MSELNGRIEERNIVKRWVLDFFPMRLQQRPAGFVCLFIKGDEVEKIEMGDVVQFFHQRFGSAGAIAARRNGIGRLQQCQVAFLFYSWID